MFEAFVNEFIYSSILILYKTILLLSTKEFESLRPVFSMSVMKKI